MSSIDRTTNDYLDNAKSYSHSEEVMFHGYDEILNCCPSKDNYIQIADELELGSEENESGLNKDLTLVDKSIMSKVNEEI